MNCNNGKTDIQTQSGNYFDFIEPHRNVFSIEDIARSLSKLCRFVGHTRSFYSVAQHCVLASYLVPPEDAYAALMHDAAEAFTGDVSRPLKQLLPDFKEIERRVEAAVFSRFHVPNPLPESVKRADMVMLATERRDLMPADGERWACLDGVDAATEKIVPVGPATACADFLFRYMELRGMEC